MRVYLERWLATKQARPKTLHRYQELLEVHVVPRLGALPLPKLEPHHVNRLLASKHAGGLSARTCNHMRAVLRNALHDAARVAMEVLGHSQISTTMDIYTKVYPELQREAARAIDKVLDPDGAV